MNNEAQTEVLAVINDLLLPDNMEQTELIESLREAIAEMNAGKGIPLEILKAELDERYGGQPEPKNEKPPTPTR